MFMKISKAMDALTDPVARENWEKYGNPDGPGAMMFGVAIPAWVVSEKYSKYGGPPIKTWTSDSCDPLTPLNN